MSYKIAIKQTLPQLIEPRDMVIGDLAVIVEHPLTAPVGQIVLRAFDCFISLTDPSMQWALSWTTQGKLRRLTPGDSVTLTVK